MNEKNKKIIKMQVNKNKNYRYIYAWVNLIQQQYNIIFFLFIYLFFFLSTFSFSFSTIRWTVFLYFGGSFSMMVSVEFDRITVGVTICDIHICKALIRFHIYITYSQVYFAYTQNLIVTQNDKWCNEYLYYTHVCNIYLFYRLYIINSNFSIRVINLLTDKFYNNILIHTHTTKQIYILYKRNNIIIILFIYIY